MTLTFQHQHCIDKNILWLVMLWIICFLDNVFCGNNVFIVNREWGVDFPLDGGHRCPDGGDEFNRAPWVGSERSREGSTGRKGESKENFGQTGKSLSLEAEWVSHCNAERSDWMLIMTCNRWYKNIQ